MECRQGLPKSGNGIDFYMPIPLPVCTAEVFVRRCGGEKVTASVFSPQRSSTIPSLTFSCRLRKVCDLALRSAADSGTKATDEANALFKRATEVLGNYSERKLRL